MNWKRVSIDSISEVVTKGTTPTSIGFGFATEGIPFLRVNNIQNGKLIIDDILFINSVTDKALARSRILPRDPLVSIAGTIGRTAIVPPDATAMNCNQAVAIVRLHKDVNPRYINYWLRTNDAKKQISGAKVTATISNLSLGCIKELQVPLPPIAQQRRIAEILDRADAIRRKRQEAIRLTEELLRSAFLEMFGDPVTNPKGWEVVSLGEISKVQGGLQVTTKRDSNPLEAPYLRVANVYRDRLVLDEIKIIRVTQQELDRATLDAGDLLIVEGHGNNKEIGRSSVWDGSIPNCTHQNHLIRVRLNLEKADPTYISAFLNSSGGRRQLTQFGKTTSGLNTISTSNVKAAKIMLPSPSEQRKYAKVKQRGSTCSDSHQKNLEKLNDLFISLLQSAFRGEL